MPSRRVPRTLEPNPWSRALDRARATGRDLADLTDADPIRVGLARLGPAERTALAEATSACHAPDPSGLLSAREAIACYYAERGVSVDPRDLVLTTGTSEAYAHLFRLLCDPGDVVLVPAPGYPLFEPIAAMEGVRTAPYRLAFDGRWHIDLGSIERAAANARALVLVQPNHPTGTVPDAAELAAVARICREHDLAILSDEVFGDFAWDGRAGGFASALTAFESPVFVTSGLSKTCGMPQLKLGWIGLGGSPGRDERREGLRWISDLYLSVGAPVQHALPSLLAAGGPFRRRTLERIARNRESIARACAGSAVSMLPAEGGWAAVLRVPASQSDEAWSLALLERAVVVHPGHFYDFDADGHLVVSLIVEPDTFARGIDVLLDLVRAI
jgi:aspartate/methionine/tyrosine aminotransferase